MHSWNVAVRSASTGAAARSPCYADKYDAKVAKALDQRAAADGRADDLRDHADAKRNSAALSTAGSVLGGLLGGRKSAGSLCSVVSSATPEVPGAGVGARRHPTDVRGEAEGKVSRLDEQIAALESELESEVAVLTAEWSTKANTIGSMRIGLEKTDVRVTQICLAWLPV